jgi:hypothetical protein
MVDRAWRVVAAAILVVIGFAGCNSGEGQAVTVLRGKTTAVNDVRTAIFFEGKRVVGPRFDFIDVDGGWRVAGADWYGDDNSWHSNGTAPCLEKPAPQSIEMGVIEAAPHEDGGGGRGVVVWLKCL